MFTGARSFKRVSVCIFGGFLLFIFKNQTLLTPWRQNPKVHHRIHNSLPLAPFLS
jgi:hypothetical protein